MSEPEKKSVALASVVLLVASIARGGWELRTPPPILPPDTSVYAELVEGTRQAVADEERRRTPLAAGERIDVNGAPEVELARLPGVGPALARRIVEAREEEGFRRPEDLLRVPGIGAATLERIREHVEVGPPPRGAPGFPFSPQQSERIVEARMRSGGFRSLDDLLEVSGIGPATLERIRPHATVRP